MSANHERQQSPNSSKALSRLVKGLAVLVILPILWSGRQAIFDVLAFVSNREAVTAYLQSYGIWGPALLELLLSGQVVFAVIPGHIIMITGGYLYGFGAGLALNLAGTVVASQIAFVVVRWAGRPLVSANLLDRWNRTAGQQGFFFFLFLFWFPIVPSNVMNFVAALSTISFWLFLAANFFGRLPGVVLITLIGSHGLELSARQWMMMAVVGGTLFLAGRYAAEELRQRYFESKGVVNV